MIAIGIDPGVSGAVAIYDRRRRRFLDVMDMPTQGTKRRRVDAVALREIVERARPTLAHIESVFCTKSALTSLSLGDSFGTAKGVCAGLGVPFSLWDTRAWKHHFGLIGADAETRLAGAREIEPDLTDKLKRKTKDHGRADAMFICLYGETQLYPLTH